MKDGSQSPDLGTETACTHANESFMQLFSYPSLRLSPVSCLDASYYRLDWVGHLGGPINRFGA